MSEFSVKKPLTIFIAVVAILVLGIVAYFKMTPDLLPNIDLPYVIVMTTYPGATPEKVETAVTKPIEQSMATLSNIKSISSTSSANYSLVILEFEDSVNMDTITVDILQNISLIEGYWEETVGTPYILKINPSMLPVMVAAVDQEGAKRTEISTLVDTQLSNELEGIAGVASISSTGIVEEKVHVFINQDKIDKLNTKVEKKIQDKMDEARQELLDAQKEAEDAKKELEDGEAELKKGREELASKMGDAEKEIATNEDTLLENKVGLQSQMVTLRKTKDDLVKTKKQLVETKEAIAQLEAAKTQLQAGIEKLTTLLSLPDEVLALQGLNRAELEAQLQGMVDKLAEVEKGLSDIDAALAKQGLTRDSIDTSLAEVKKGIEKINNGLGQMEIGVNEIKNGQTKVYDGIETLEEEKIKAILEMAEASAKISVGKDKLETALTQIEDGLEQLDDAQEDALEAADLTNKITMGMVSGLLTAQNFEMPLGYVEQDGVEYMISVGENIGTYEELRDLPLFDLGIEGEDVVKLSDVADIAITDNAASTYAKINGNDGVLISFTKQSTYATAEVSKNITAKFEELESEYPGLKFTKLMDQGDYIYLVVNSILQNIFLGALFAVIILFIFLKDFRPTLITLCSIPISVIFAIVLMYFSGVTLNMISLSGLAISVGMLVDNSVVVIENTHRLKSMGVSPIKAAVSGAKQVAGAVTASTLTTICVFLPIVFVEGIIRQLFVDMALTITYSLLASLIIALTLVPAMESFMLKGSKERKDFLLGYVKKGYRFLLSLSLNHKIITLAIVLFLLVLSVVLTVTKGFIFMPETSSTQVSVTITMPEGATLDESIAASDEVMDAVMQIPEVTTVGAMFESNSTILTAASDDYSAITQYVMLDENMKRSSMEITEEINNMFADRSFKVDAVNSTDISSYMTALGGDGVALNVYSTNNDLLEESAQKLADVLSQVDGIYDVKNGMQDAETEYLIHVDKQKAAKEGLTVAQVYTGISELLTSTKDATKLDCVDKNYQVVVHTDNTDDILLSEVRDYEFKVTDQEGEEKKVKLTDIAAIEEQLALSEISRSDQKRYLTVSGKVSENENITLVTERAEEAVKNITLPSGVTYKFTGEKETIMQGLKDLTLMFLLSVLLVYLIMVAQFQSLRSPFIVMFTLPLAITGGLFALTFAGMEISVISMVGFVMLAGIIVNNGIVLVDYINQLRVEGIEKREAVIEAGVTRMRPIFMTSITTVLGLSIMAFGGGMENDMVRPIALVSIGGLVYATILTLFIIPVLYEMFAAKNVRKIDEEDLITSEL